MAQKEQATANRNYKDTVFRMLFSDWKNLLSLYNAVSGAHYDDPEKLEIITLENAIYMGMKNDLAFIIGTDLFLYEHQSTYNPNMPLRDLFYISSEYQKLVDKKSLYSSVLQKIPAPQFIVFYNGTEKKKAAYDQAAYILSYFPLFCKNPAHFQVVYHALHHIIIGKFRGVDHQIVVLKILPALSGIVAVIVAALPVDPLNIL